MEGDLQPLYLLLTDCYIYLLRKGNQKNNVLWLSFFVVVVFGEAFSNLLAHVLLLESNTFAFVFFYRCSR